MLYAILSWVFVLGGGLMIFLGISLSTMKPAPTEVAPIADVKTQRDAEYVYVPPVLPPEGPAIGAERNQVWEARDGTLFDISAPIRGKLIGHEKPKVIDSERGWTMSRMMEWRMDGVATSGETNLDLVKRNADLKPYLYFNEDGYATLDGAPEGKGE